ncbi:hypothetical protein [Stutzerimonas stutzeri]|uniref:hypothetical protein n=1 Tax=Stutzerimonas stutzeri TaxID=316 RepID=UPI00210EA6BB|nr:hypothetical protein [Stutzerimonas stutzeri]MCQ4319932.1 hypothetical protein [Stutzerimonas stutzeri]
MLEVKGASFSIVAPSLARQTARNECTDHDGLLQRLLRYFPEALSAALLLLLLACWHAAQRQGPLPEPRRPEVANSFESICEAVQIIATGAPDSGI